MRGNASNPNGPTCNNRFLCYLASDAFVIRVSGLGHYYFAKLVAFMLTLQHMAVAQCPISHLSRHHCSFRQGNRTQCALKFKWRRLHFCEEWLTTVSAVQLMSRVFLLSIQSQVAVTERPFSFVYPGSLEESDNNKLWRMDGKRNH